jgi:outer membrane protein OmpA-like peptidoglycan-associated protein
MTVASAALLAVAACSGFEYQEVKGMPAASNPYHAALQKGYVELSKWEFDEGDYIDSDVFAKRAEASAKGQPPKPEEIGARKLPADKVGELTEARNKLMAALNATASSKNPAEAARAQVMFDCWMQEQEENFQPNNIKGCKDAFNASLAKIESAPAAAVPPPPMTTPDRYLVFFDWDKADLTADARKVLAQVAENAKKGKVAKITCVGHTDRSGSEAYNMGLSQRRANNVKAELVRLGLSAKEIATVAKGEANPLVPTKDGVREAQNRRVEIMFGKAGA